MSRVLFALLLAGCGASSPSSDGGADAGVDAGTCPSQLYWTRGTAAAAAMEPGMACIACHQTQAPSLAYDFMGTVFAEYHSEDTCFGQPPPDVTVEILGADGGVAVTLTPNSAGNFFTGRNSGVQTPYTARVRFDGGVNVMLTPQTDGDCNGCHTAQGLNGAPGRITWL
ncbi:MAG: hypothetical protein QM723_25800 [Myxococcaceae bacterium]